MFFESGLYAPWRGEYCYALIFCKVSFEKHPSGHSVKRSVFAFRSLGSRWTACRSQPNKILDQSDENQIYQTNSP